jgi:hypothetical protein
MDRNVFFSRLTYVSLLFATALAVGCSGGGGGGGTSLGGVLPTIPPVSSPDPGKVGASLTFHIPARTKSALRRGRTSHYISPNTASLTVLVGRVTGSPWPSPLPLQLLVVATPSPCSGTPETGLTCSFAVQAYVGQDTFVFNTYQVAHPGPHDIPLSTYASGITTVSGRPSPLVFTLEGVVQSITLAVPSPESSNAPLTADLPIGTPATFPLVVTPKDASGAAILIDTFASPISLSVAPAAGIGLKLASPCPGNPGPTSGAKITLVCGNELAGVTVTYDGSLTPAAGGGYVDSATIVAAPQPGTAAQPPATVALESVLRAYPMATSQDVFSESLAFDSATGDMLVAADTIGSAGLLVAFNPETPATDTTLPLAYSPLTLLVARSNHIWIGEQYPSQGLNCYTGFGAPPAFVSTTGGGNPVFPTATVEDAAGNVWWTGSDGTGAIWTGFVADAANCHVTATSNAVTGIAAIPYYLSGIAAAPPGVLIGANQPSSPSNVALYQVSTATASSPNPVNLGSTYYSGSFVNDAALNVYAFFGASESFPNATPVFVQIPAGSTTPKVIASMPPNDFVGNLAQFSGAGTTAAQLAGEDGEFAGMELYNLVTSAGLVIPFSLPQGYCDGIAYDASGLAWEGCSSPLGTGFTVYNPVLTSTWAVAPVAFRTSTEPQTEVLAVLQKGADSSPFTVTANSNPAFVTVQPSWPGFTHDIPIQLNLRTGSASLTVVDKNGRSQTVTISNAIPPPPDLRHRTRWSRGRSARSARLR